MRMRREWLNILPLLLLLIVTSCRVSRPKDVLSPKKMEMVLYDYHLSQAILNNLDPSERYMRDSYIEWVYKKNGIERQDFDRSLVWYTRHPKEFSQVYEKMTERISRDRNLAAMYMERIEKSSYSVMSGDSVDLWYLNRSTLLSVSPFLDRLSFSINADTTFYPGDTLRWTMRTAFISNPADSIPMQLYLCMNATYKRDGGSVVVDTLLDSATDIQLSLVTDTMGSLNTLSGFVCYMDSSYSRIPSVLLTDISLIRRHQ